MKIASGALAAALLAMLAWATPIAAQGLPQGSYLRSCNGVRMEGDTLVARCRTAQGFEQRTALAQVRRCVGDIGNNNGVLQCTLRGGGQNYGQVLGEPGRGPGRGPPPLYGQGYGPDRWERCRGLHREAEELRERLAREWNPLDRQRLEWRLREVYEQQERCRY
jgi:hypothetical protein